MAAVLKAGEPLTLWPRGTCRGQGETILLVSETPMHLEARTPVWQGGALLHGSVIAVIREPWIRLGLVPVVSRGLAPCGAGSGVVAWILDQLFGGI
jgi:hypothetical protein